MNAIGTVPVYVPASRATSSPAAAHARRRRLLPARRRRRAAVRPGAPPRVLDRRASTTVDGQRWSPLDATADIGRIERQQDFIKKLGRIAVAAHDRRPVIAPDLADELMPEPRRRHRVRPHRVQRARARLHGAHLGRRRRPAVRDPAVETPGSRSAGIVPAREAARGRRRARPAAGRGAVRRRRRTTTTRAAQATPRCARSTCGSGCSTAPASTGAAATADQALRTCGFVSGGDRRTTPARRVTQTRDPLRPGDEAKAQLLAAWCPAPSSSPTPRSAATSCWSSGRTSRASVRRAPKDTRRDAAPRRRVARSGLPSRARSQ